MFIGYKARDSVASNRERVSIFLLLMTIICVLVLNSSFTCEWKGTHQQHPHVDATRQRNAKTQISSSRNDDVMKVSNSLPRAFVVTMGDSIVKPLLIEVGAMVLLQTLGIPVVSKLLFSFQKVRWNSLFRSLHVSKAVLQSGKVWMRNTGKLWHSLKDMYKKTGATKVVRETKRIVHSLEEEHDS